MTGHPIKLRIIFMGTSSFAQKILGALVNAEYNIVSVYTQPDKRTGRKQEIKKGAVKVLAEERNIPVFEPSKLDEDNIKKIADQKPDLIIVASYGKILPKSLLDIPGFGCVNVHASLLPKFRGPSPVQNALLLGEKETGVTIMLMNEGVDTGDILSQKKIKIDKDETAPELLEKLSQTGVELILETVPLWAKRKIDPRKQNSEDATLCQLIERADGQIIWSDEAESIYNRYRAFQPWPGIFTFWQKDEYPRRVKLCKVSYLKNNPENTHHEGEVFQIGDKIGVQTGKGIIILEEVQLEGKEKIAIEGFVRGYGDFVGSILK